MPNLRIIADNVADRATMSASTTSGALVVAYVQTNRKSDVYRATGTSATLTGTYTVSESASSVALLGNFSPTATIRVRLYSDTAGTTLVLDTNTLQPSALACPAAAIQLRGWTAAQSASAYAFGGGAFARIWFALTSFKRVVIDIVDTSNAQGYVEVARLIAGTYWSPTYNASAVSDIDVDTVKQDRNDAGDLMSDAGTIHKRVPISLEYMPATDRTTLKGLLRGSRANPIFVSIFPGVSDLELERDHTVYGQRMTDSEIAVQAAIMYGTKIEVESI
jgi:hypothetical protein